MELYRPMTTTYQHYSAQVDDRCWRSETLQPPTLVANYSELSNKLLDSDGPLRCLAIPSPPESDNHRTLLFVANDVTTNMRQMRTCAEEVKARGAQLTIITDNPRLAEGLDPNPIVIPNNVRSEDNFAFNGAWLGGAAAFPHH